MERLIPIDLKIPKPNAFLRAGLFILVLKVLVPVFTYIQMPGWLDDALSVLGALCLLASLSGRKYKLGTLLVCGAVGLLALLTSFLARNLSLFLTLLTILAISHRKNTIRLLFRYEVLVISVLFAIAMVLTLLGVNLEVLASGEMVYVYGFIHPNMLGAVFYNLAGMWMWLHYDRLDIKHYLFFIGYYIVLFLMTGSRTCFAIGLFCVLLTWFSRQKADWIKPFLKYSAQWIFPLIAVVIIGLVLAYRSENGLVMKLDSLLSARIKLGAFAYEHFGPTLFGQVIDFTKDFGWSDFWRLQNLGTFDNLYTYFMMNYGIVWLFVVSIALWLLARRGQKKTNVMLICWAVYSITEVVTLNGYLAFPILLTSHLLSNRFRLWPKKPDQPSVWKQAKRVPESDL